MAWNLNNLNIKISAAGCPNSCGIAQLNDVGFYGVVEPEIDRANCNQGCRLCIPICKRRAIQKKGNLAVIDKEKCAYCGQCISVCPFEAIAEKRKGFAVFVGGKEGEDTQLGDKIAEFLSEEEALQLAEECIRILKERNINAATIVDEVGLERFKEMLVPSPQ